MARSASIGRGQVVVTDRTGTASGGGGSPEVHSIQNTTGGLVWPYPINKSNLGGNMLIDAVGEKAAKVFQVPKTGTIVGIGFVVETYTASGTPDVRLETVDTGTGDPSGTLVDANTNGSILVNAGNAAYEVTLTAPYVATAGETLAAVIVQDATGNFQIKAPNPENDSSFPYSDLYTTSWSKQQIQSSHYLIYSDGSRPFLPSTLTFHDENVENINTSTTPDEIGIKFTLPHQTRVSGVVSQGVFNADYDVVLYDDSDTVLASVSHDTTLLATGATDRYNYLLFDSMVTLEKDTTYRLVYKPTTTSTMQVRYLAFPNTAVKGVMGYEDITYTERTDAGAWTDTDTKITQVSLIIDGLLG